MILRKPYAFLIKYFRRINILLLGLVLFAFYRMSKFSQFAKNYVNTGMYNSQIDSINNYFNSYIVLDFIAIFLISVVLIYLLKKKEKPIIGYTMTFIFNLYNFIFLIYVNNFFTYKALDGFKLVTAKVISDLSFIGVILYYPLLIILLIRSLGIDLRSFGFREDKEYLEVSEEDREEVEVQVGFDKEKWIRKVKYYFRNIRYFILEHKVPLAVITSLVAIIGITQFYRYFYVENRIYKMNQTISSNNYKLRVNSTYLTNKDYSGNIISNDGSYFVVVDLSVKNSLGIDRLFDIEKVLLYIDNSYYVPSFRYNNSFKDMGNLYDGIELKGNQEKSYLLIYQVPKPTKNANFVLKYQDVSIKNSKLIRIKINVVDISAFKMKGIKHYNDEMTIPLSLENKMIFTINNYTISDTTTYTYQSCGSDGSCPIYEKETSAKNGYKILHFKFDSNKESKEFINFINTYAKVRYVIDNSVKVVNIKRAVDTKYKGKHVYLLVPNEIENADSIDLLFTVRSYQYIYRLKGE